MRGKLNHASARRDAAGITPADAGKTRRDKSRGKNGRDHPRGCGENSFIWNMKQQGEGSPPRMRGKPSLRIGVSPLVRITPADAGKTPVLRND